MIDADRLSTFFAAGMTDAEMAAILSVGARAVSASRRRLGLLRRHPAADKPRSWIRPVWSDSEIAILRELVAAETSDPDIAKALGTRTPAQVRSKRGVLGLKSARPNGRPRTFDDALLTGIRERMSTGESVRRIASDLGLHPSSVYWRLRLLQD